MGLVEGRRRVQRRRLGRVRLVRRIRRIGLLLDEGRVCRRARRHPLLRCVRRRRRRRLRPGARRTALLLQLALITINILSIGSYPGRKTKKICIRYINIYTIYKAKKRFFGLANLNNVYKFFYI